MDYNWRVAAWPAPALFGQSVPPTAGRSAATAWCSHVNMDHTFEEYFQQHNEPHKRESNPALALTNKEAGECKSV